MFRAWLVVVLEDWDLACGEPQVTKGGYFIVLCLFSRYLYPVVHV